MKRQSNRTSSELDSGAYRSVVQEGNYVNDHQPPTRICISQKTGQITFLSPLPITSEQQVSMSSLSEPDYFKSPDKRISSENFNTNRNETYGTSSEKTNHFIFVEGFDEHDIRKLENKSNPSTPLKLVARKDTYYRSKRGPYEGMSQAFQLK
jgi:hypothetical protein